MTKFKSENKIKYFEILISLIYFFWKVIQITNKRFRCFSFNGGIQFDSIISITNWREWLSIKGCKEQINSDFFVSQLKLFFIEQLSRLIAW